VFYAASRGHLQALKKLVQYGGLINMLTIERATPLMAAAKAGHLAVVEYLISQGATIDARDYSGKSALMLAVWHEKPEVAKFLLQQMSTAEFRHQQDTTGGNNKDKEEEEARVSHILANKDERPVATLRTDQDLDYSPMCESEEQPHDLFDDDEDEDRGLMLDDSMEDEEEEEEISRPVLGASCLRASSPPPQHHAGGKIVGPYPVSWLDRPDEMGETVLMLAVKRKNRELIRMLMESGADALTVLDGQGRNCLALAQTYGVVDVLKPFLPPAIQKLFPDSIAGEPSPPSDCFYDEEI